MWSIFTDTWMKILSCLIHSQQARYVIADITELKELELRPPITLRWNHQLWAPVSQYERPRAVVLASSACVNKTTKIITEFTRKDPFLYTSETSELSTAKGIIMK